MREAAPHPALLFYRMGFSDMVPGGMGKAESVKFAGLLAARGLAAPVEEEGRRHFLIDASVHRTLAESLVDRRLPLRAAQVQTTPV